MRGLSIGAALLVLVGPLAVASAETADITELPIEELLNIEVISASRIGQKVNQAPTSLSVWTAADIRTFGWRTLSDALNAMRGLFTSNDRNYSYLGMRGFMHTNDYNSRVLFMIDGQRMNENIFDGGYMAQEFMLDLDLVERIEFIPGGGSSIYGANAFSGFINIITKTGRSIDGSQLAVDGGSYDTYKGRVSYGKTLANGADVLFSGSHYDSAGVPNLYFPEFNSPATNNGVASHLDSEYADRLFGRIKYREFTLMGGFVGRLKQVPTASFGAIFNDPDNRTNDQQFFGNLKYEKALSDKTTIQLKGSYQGYDYSAIEPIINGGRVLNFDGAEGRWWSGNAQLTSTAFAGHRLLVGLEYQYDQRQHIFNYNILPYQNALDSNSHGSRAQLYGQDDMQIMEDVVFSAGLRLDYTHMLKNLQLNPRLGLVWNPLQSTTYKLLYSTTFRAPNVWEREYNVGQIPNPNSYEERIRSYEGIVEWRSSTGLKILGDLFYNDMYQILEQNIVSDAGGLPTFLNNGHYHTLGAELEAEKRWSGGRLLKASYTYSLLTDVNQGNSWGYASPQNMFKLHYAEPLFNNFATLGLESIYIGDRRALQGGFAEAYDLINLNLSSDRIMPGMFASASVYNLLDTHFQMLGGGGPNDLVQNTLQMNGREFRLKLQFTF